MSLERLVLGQFETAGIDDSLSRFPEVSYFGN